MTNNVQSTTPLDDEMKMRVVGSLSSLEQYRTLVDKSKLFEDGVSDPDFPNNKEDFNIWFSDKVENEPDSIPEFVRNGEPMSLDDWKTYIFEAVVNKKKFLEKNQEKTLT